MIVLDPLFTLMTFARRRVMVRILHYIEGELMAPESSPEHPAWDDAEYGSSFEESLYTASPQDYPEEMQALSATDVKRFIVVGTQNCKSSIVGECIVV